MSDLDQAYADAREKASAGLKATLTDMLGQLVMTQDEVAAIIRATAIGIGQKCDQVGIVRHDDGLGLMVYLYHSSEPDSGCAVFSLPEAICKKVA